jgi:hypothetical protein
MLNTLGAGGGCARVLCDEGSVEQMGRTVTFKHVLSLPLTRQLLPAATVHMVRLYAQFVARGYTAIILTLRLVFRLHMRGKREVQSHFGK